MKTQSSQTLLQAQLEIQEQTHQHIGKELHDNLGQVASLIKINLNTLKLSDTEKEVTKLADTKDLLRQMIADIKSLSVSLGADRLTQSGLIKAIETDIERINKTDEFTASLQIDGAIPVIGNDTAIILYRMVQEVLNNMVKHSKATQINCVIRFSENLLTLVLSDNGVGFNMDEKLNGGGAGLRNLQNRARLINAQFNTQTSPGAGTKISIQLPL